MVLLKVLIQHIWCTRTFSVPIIFHFCKRFLCKHLIILIVNKKVLKNKICCTRTFLYLFITKNILYTFVFVVIYEKILLHITFFTRNGTKCVTFVYVANIHGSRPFCWQFCKLIFQICTLASNVTSGYRFKINSKLKCFFTIMYSSRMRTVRCSDLLGGGGCLPRGVFAQGGVFSRECLPRGVSAHGGACLGGVYTSPLGTEWLTDRCKNITFPRTVKILRAVLSLPSHCRDKIKGTSTIYFGTMDSFLDKIPWLKSFSNGWMASNE